jgi:RimJ/RimL family protein N-acetyltransferase
VQGVQLRPATAADFAPAKRWIDDPEVHRWLEPPLRSGDLRPLQFQLWLTRDEVRLYTIELEGLAVGLLGLLGLSRDQRRAELFYLVGEVAARGRGVATAAIGLACDEAFGPLGLRSLFAWVAAPNEASSRALIRSHFRLAGRQREGFEDGGRAVDRLLYDRLAGDRP